MRISDWSSDVCSSDLGLGLAGVGADVEGAGAETGIGEGFPELGKGGADGLGRARRVGADLDVHQAAFHADPQLEASEVGGFELEREVVIPRSEEHTSELQSLMRITYAVVCLKTKTK